MGFPNLLGDVMWEIYSQFNVTTVPGNVPEFRLGNKPGILKRSLAVCSSCGRIYQGGKALQDVLINVDHKKSSSGVANVYMGKTVPVMQVKFPQGCGYVVVGGPVDTPHSVPREGKRLFRIAYALRDSVPEKCMGMFTRQYVYLQLPPVRLTGLSPKCKCERAWDMQPLVENIPAATAYLREHVEMKRLPSYLHLNAEGLENLKSDVVGLSLLELKKLMDGLGARVVPAFRRLLEGALSSRFELTALEELNRFVEEQKEPTVTFVAHTKDCMVSVVYTKSSCEVRICGEEQLKTAWAFLRSNSASIEWHPTLINIFHTEVTFTSIPPVDADELRLRMFMDFICFFYSNGVYSERISYARLFCASLLCSPSLGSGNTPPVAVPPHLPCSLHIRPTKPPTPVANFSLQLTRTGLLSHISSPATLETAIGKQYITLAALEAGWIAAGEGSIPTHHCTTLLGGYISKHCHVPLSFAFADLLHSVTPLFQSVVPRHITDFPNEFQLLLSGTDPVEAYCVVLSFRKNRNGTAFGAKLFDPMGNFQVGELIRLLQTNKQKTKKHCITLLTNALRTMSTEMYDLAHDPTPLSCLFMCLAYMAVPLWSDNRITVPHAYASICVSDLLKRLACILPYCLSFPPHICYIDKSGCRQENKFI